MGDRLVHVALPEILAAQIGQRFGKPGIELQHLFVFGNSLLDLSQTAVGHRKIIPGQNEVRIDLERALIQIDGPVGFPQRVQGEITPVIQRFLGNLVRLQQLLEGEQFLAVQVRFQVFDRQRQVDGPSLQRGQPHHLIVLVDQRPAAESRSERRGGVDIGKSRKRLRMHPENEPVGLEQKSLHAAALHLHRLGGITQHAGVIVFLEAVRVADLQRRIQVAIQLEDAEVHVPVEAHHPLHRHPVAVSEDRFDRGRVHQHMVIGDQGAVGFDDKTGSRPEGLTLAVLGDQQNDGVFVDLVAESRAGDQKQSEDNPCKDFPADF